MVSVMYTSRESYAAIKPTDRQTDRPTEDDEEGRSDGGCMG